MQNIFIDVLPPWVETGLQPAFYDLESGTVLQQTARMWAKMREYGVAFTEFTTNVTNEINAFEQNVNDNIEEFEKNVTDTVDEYIEKFTELKEYVEDYFENLDVQEEINHKLDEMADEGTLQEIITTYIQSNVEWTFDTVADMKSATNLINGSYAKTLGFHTINDGGGATYLVSNSGTADELKVIALQNSMYAHLVITSDANVNQFGAYGDGTHDDATSIQTAINSTSEVHFKNQNYLIGSTLTLNDNNVLIGDDATISPSSDIEAFKYNPDPITANIYTYTVTGNESSDTLYIVKNGVNYSVTLPSRTAGDILYFNPTFGIATWISSDYTYEREYKLGADGTGSDITSQCVSNARPLPSDYLTNVTIDGITISYATDNINKYAIYLRFAKDITITNCHAIKAGLVWVGLDKNLAGGPSTTTDWYLASGFSSAILNNNIKINNCSAIGTPVEKYSDVAYQTSGIYLQYCSNCECNNNDLSYLFHGISIWGGNVGPNNFCEYDMLRFCNNIVTNNNRIYCVRYGGIWSSRASNQICNSNEIDINGDVGIDIEGGLNSVVDGNVSNNSRNGNLAGFYGSYNIVYSNNACRDDNIVDCTHMFLFNDNVTNHICNFILTGNTFTCTTRITKAIQLNGALRGKCIIDDNTFINCGIYRAKQSAPLTEIKNNIFRCYDNIDLTDFEAFIVLLADNRTGGPQVIIENNTFDVATHNNNNYGYYKNNSNFDGKYAITFTGGAYGFHPHVIVDSNKIYGFNKSVLLDHQAPSGDNNGTFYMYMYRNIISGPVLNTSDTRGFIVYEGNKTCYNGDNAVFKRPMSNYPNAIPTDSTYGAWAVGTRIMFDTPTNGYTGAICTTAGTPGTWVKFGATE